MDENGNELHGNQVDGRLMYKISLASYSKNYLGKPSTLPLKPTFLLLRDMYFTGDGALRDAVGYYQYYRKSR
jgi:acetyl-CoA synthetase